MATATVRVPAACALGIVSGARATAAVRPSALRVRENFIAFSSE
jgi:hypothetical protein